jgi:hypothetical protein
MGFSFFFLYTVFISNTWICLKPEKDRKVIYETFHLGMGLRPLCFLGIPKNPVIDHGFSSFP